MTAIYTSAVLRASHNAVQAWHEWRGAYTSVPLLSSIAIAYVEPGTVPLHVCAPLPFKASKISGNRLCRH